MNLTLTNKTATPVTVASPDEEGWVDVLHPEVGYEVNRPATTVIIIGDKPDFREQLAQAKDVLSAVARKLVAAITGSDTATPLAATAEAVSVDVQNNGENDVRVILGDGVSDITVAHAAMQNCAAKGYLELRELGMVNPNIEQQPSEAA